MKPASAMSLAPKKPGRLLACACTRPAFAVATVTAARAAERKRLRFDIKISMAGTQACCVWSLLQDVATNNGELLYQRFRRGKANDSRHSDAHSAPATLPFGTMRLSRGGCDRLGSKNGN